MVSYMVRRLFSTAIVMTFVGVFVFLTLHLSTVDPAAIIAGDSASAEQVATIRQHLGLDEPLTVQFGHWAMRVLRGDLGTSVFSQASVAGLIWQRLEPTLSLALLTVLVSVTIAVAVGVMAAWKANSWVDRGLIGLSMVGYSIPNFVIGYVLIYFFAIQLRWLPVQGYTPLAEGLGPWASHLVLPTITLGLVYVALIARMTRSAMLEILEEDYIRTAKSKGLGTRAVLFTHALRNAGVPIVTVVGVSVTLLIGGVVITETVFNIPGIGRLVVDAVLKRDYPIIQGVLLVFSAVYILVNLLVDLSYSLIDPRIRIDQVRPS